jgi:lipopolysaccharide/colanic/teichoic acid biosynthesis glycosyltransferase
MTQSHPTDAPHSGDRSQRMANLAIALALIILTLPLLILVAVAIKCETRGAGPVFSWRQRCVAPGYRFLALQFRTTAFEADQAHRVTWREGRVEYTRVGQVLRITRIGNLPQLYNVLRGEMSCINPRPECPFFLS